jgi:ribonuclease HII
MICGVDEAGRGPVIGPLVVAGVKIESDEKIAHLNVRDSKKCTPKRRENLARELLRLVEVEVKKVPAYEIDLLREVYTLNIIESKLFATIIECLHPDIAYVDSADVSEENFKRDILRELKFDVEIISKHGADDLYPVVSAASIVAKTQRDQEIEGIKMDIGEEIGSGYPSDAVTIDFIKSWIDRYGELPPHTRKSWKTAKRLIDQSKHITLDKFE